MRRSPAQNIGFAFSCVTGRTRMSSDQATPVSRSRRRFLCFSVRGMLVAVLVIGGWFGWIVRRAHVQRNAVEAILRAGGRVRYDWQFRNGALVRNGAPKGPKWLVGLLGPHYFDNVTMVELAGGATDTELAQLGNLALVDTLVLNSSCLSESGLSHLDRLTGLRWLTITGPVRSRVVPPGVLKRIEGLNIDGTDVTDAWLQCLTGMNRIELLGLTRTTVTDAGLAHLPGVTGLQHLYLDGTEIGDEGLAYLKPLAKLKGLHVKGTKVSDIGARDFERAMPNVEVYR